MFACGPTPMLQATARVARRFGVPCQVSLEEFMACAVGGCAGCAVPVVTDIRARDEARLRGRAGVRRERGVPAGGVAPHWPSRSTHDSGQDFRDQAPAKHRSG